MTKLLIHPFDLFINHRFEERITVSREEWMQFGTFSKSAQQFFTKPFYKQSYMINGRPFEDCETCMMDFMHCHGLYFKSIQFLRCCYYIFAMHIYKYTLSGSLHIICGESEDASWFILHLPQPWIVFYRLNLYYRRF